MTTTISMLAIGAWPGTPIEGLVLTSVTAPTGPIHAAYRP